MARYDVVALTMYNGSTPTISNQAKENLLNFVKSGKGFYVQHLASASFKEWDEFGKLCGRKWVMGTSGHGPRSDINVEIANHEHPITKGMTDFVTNDELYAKLQGTGAINVLVTADSDWSNATEPLLFTLDYGQGRVVHTDGAAAVTDGELRAFFARDGLAELDLEGDVVAGHDHLDALRQRRQKRLKVADAELEAEVITWGWPMMRIYDDLFLKRVNRRRLRHDGPVDRDPTLRTVSALGNGAPVHSASHSPQGLTSLFRSTHSVPHTVPAPSPAEPPSAVVPALPALPAR